MKAIRLLFISTCILLFSATIASAGGNDPHGYWQMAASGCMLQGGSGSAAGGTVTAEAGNYVWLVCPVNGVIDQCSNSSNGSVTSFSLYSKNSTTGGTSAAYLNQVSKATGAETAIASVSNTAASFNQALYINTSLNVDFASNWYYIAIVLTGTGGSTETAYEVDLDCDID